jgi:2-dehydropantoate 2-reductase
VDVGEVDDHALVEQGHPDEGGVAEVLVREQAGGDRGRQGRCQVPVQADDERISSMTASRVAVIGAGAIGSVLAGAACQAGNDVTLCVRTPIPSLAVSADGAERDVPVRITADPRSVTEPADWVLLATKAYQTAGAVHWLEKLAGPETVVVVVQNGVDHTERLAPLHPAGTVLPALTYISARRDAPGRVTHVTGSRVIVPDNPAGAGLAELLAQSPVTVELSADFLTAAWRKLLANVAASPVTALTGRRMDVLGSPGILALMRDLLTEAVAAGAASGARLSSDDVTGTLEFYRRLRPDAGTSMLEDKAAGRPTEYEEITGAVVRAADKHGLAAPLNRAVFALLAAASPAARI